MMARGELAIVNSSNELSIAEVVADTSVTTTPEADHTEPELAAAHAPWVKSISSYERKETTIVEGLRYG
jgi:hypothetical protein